MSVAQAGGQASVWTEPPWSGWIATTGDALLILEAARRGLIPRVTRRLVDSERKMITSGSVFVFDEDESGIKRWTDGFYWSPSRILGNFLLYRETDKRGLGHRGAKSDAASSDNEQSMDKAEGSSLSRPKNEISQSGVEKQLERNLMGSLTNNYKFKPDGLMKKTFSLTIDGVAQHLISYYKIEDVTNGRLRCPSSLPELASLDINPEYLEKGHFRNPVKIEIGFDGIPRYRGEADEADTPSPLDSPLSTSLPVLSSTRGVDCTNRRGKRFDPYASGSTKKYRRQIKVAGEDNSHSAEESSETQEVTPTTANSEPASAIPPPPFPAPYSAANFYHFPALLPPPHPVFPPGTPLPALPAHHHPYGFLPGPAADVQQAATREAVLQPFYAFPPGYPPGFHNSWIPYGIPPFSTAPFPPPQSSDPVGNQIQADEANRAAPEKVT